ncbi:MAG: hypothetical protein JW795_22500 [Chitinivibrionales bacterium]|nr:hypothetical protein [Chitinivibrionales bacterium]
MSRRNVAILIILFYFLAGNAQLQWNCAPKSAEFVGRSHHSSVVFNDKIWVLEGRKGCENKFPNDIWSSSNGIDWTCVVDSAPFPMRVGIPILEFKSKLWLLGGGNGL